MIKALLLVFAPVATWNGIFNARRGWLFILVIYLLPLLLLTSAAEGYGLVNWGKWQGEVSHLKKFPVGEAVILEAGQCLLWLLVVFAGAILLKAIGETFHGRNTYLQAFTAVAYGLSPLFLLRLLDASSAISPWVSWAIGFLLSLAVLYYGVPRMMDPDPAHAFGLFFMSALLLMMMSGLVRFVTAACLQGKFPVLEVFISGLGARLPF